MNALTFEVSTLINLELFECHHISFDKHKLFSLFRQLDASDDQIIKAQRR